MASYPLIALAVGITVAYAAATLVAALIARAGFPLPPARHRIGCVDNLRGYLALSVLVHHFVIWMQVTRLGGGWDAPSVNLFNQFGIGSVALFFMITGLVFYPRVLAGFRACSWQAIFISRLFRIVPLIVASVAIICTIIACRTGRGPGRDFPLAAARWISSWGEPPLLGYPDSGRLNAYVLWSLKYEWLFYLLVLPACALASDLIRGRLPSWTIPLSVLTVPLLGRIIGFRLSMLTYLPLFAVGMLAYECQSREAVARRFRGPGAAIIAVALLGLGMTAASTPYGAALPLFGVFFLCIACGNDFGGLLRTKAALVLGECSYGTYLLHGTVLSLLFVDATRLTGHISTNWLPILLPLAAAFVALMTPASFLLIERPAMRLGRLFANVWTKRGAFAHVARPRVVDSAMPVEETVRDSRALAAVVVVPVRESAGE